MIKYIEEIIWKDKREVPYFNTEKKFSIKINYPSFFLDIKGKINSEFVRKFFKRLLR